jgi:hypothetical protein
VERHEVLHGVLQRREGLRRVDARDGLEVAKEHAALGLLHGLLAVIQGAEARRRRCLRGRHRYLCVGLRPQLLAAVAC